MDKITEYNKVKQEFEEWFEREIELLKLIPQDYHATQNQVVKLYQDLNTFATTHPKFQKNEYTSKTQINV